MNINNNNYNNGFSRLPAGELVFVKTSSINFDNAKIIGYNDDNSLVTVEWLSTGGKSVLPNNPDIVYSSDKKRNRVSNKSQYEDIISTENIRRVKVTKITQKVESNHKTTCKNGIVRNRLQKKYSRYQENDSSSDDEFDYIVDKKKGGKDVSIKSNSSFDSDSDIDIIKDSFGSKRKISKNKESVNSVSQEECSEAFELGYISLSRFINELTPFVKGNVIDRFREFARKNFNRKLNSGSNLRNQNSNKFETNDVGLTNSKVILQPTTLSNSCEMRSYQLEGLSWLVRQYDSGINAILADEMGLVS